MRVFVYVDGFNLYYGALESTPYKWLNIEQLCRNLLPAGAEIVSLKYFTAWVKPRGDVGAPDRQKIYVKALEATSPMLEVIPGSFSAQDKRRKISGSDPPEYATVEIMEEKGSDVNLATHLVYDACQDRFDCAVVISNDGDFAGALNMVKNLCGKQVGLLVPSKGTKRARSRKANKKLLPYVDWHHVLVDSDVAAAQLPSPIPGTAIHKPDSW